MDDTQNEYKYITFEYPYYNNEFHIVKIDNNQYWRNNRSGVIYKVMSKKKWDFRFCQYYYEIKLILTKNDIPLITPINSIEMI